MPFSHHADPNAHDWAHSPIQSSGYPDQHQYQEEDLQLQSQEPPEVEEAAASRLSQPRWWHPAEGQVASNVICPLPCPGGLPL